MNVSTTELLAFHITVLQIRELMLFGAKACHP